MELKLIRENNTPYEKEVEYEYRGYNITEYAFAEDDRTYHRFYIKKGGKDIAECYRLNNAMEFIDNREE